MTPHQLTEPLAQSRQREYIMNNIVDTIETDTNTSIAVKTDAQLVASALSANTGRAVEHINVGKNSCVRLLRKYLSEYPKFQDKYTVDQTAMLYFSSPVICPSLFDGINIGEHMIAVALPVVSLQADMYEGTEYDTRLASVEATTGKAKYPGIVTMLEYNEKHYVVAFYNHAPPVPTIASLLSYKKVHIMDVLAPVQEELI